MTRDELVLERLRAADPAPNDARIDPDELSTIFSVLEERRGAVTTQTPIRPREQPTTERRWLRPALAFGFAVMVVMLAVGLGVFLLGGEEDVIEPSERTLPTQTTAPAPTTTPTTPPSETEPPVIPSETLISEPLRTMAAMVGSDGNPIFVGEMGTDIEPTGVLRLVRCTDPDCIDEPEVVDLVSGIEWQGNLALAAGPDGHPLIGYRSGVDLDGTTFDAYTADYLPTSMTYSVLYCSDDACRDFDRYEVGSDEAFWALAVGGWTFTEDNLPLYTYMLGPPNETTLHLVACTDPGCRAGTDTPIDGAPFLRGSRFAHGAPITIMPDGGLLMAYGASAPTGPPRSEAGWDEAPMIHEVRTAYCAEARCSAGAVVTTLGEGTLPLPIAQVDGAVHIKYVSTVEGRELFEDPIVLTDVHCLNASCTSFSSTTGAPLAGGPQPWENWTYDPQGLLTWAVVEQIMGPGMVDGEEGLEPGEVPVGALMTFNRCDDTTCSSITSLEIGEMNDADYWVEARVLYAPTGEPMVALNEEAGIRVVRPPTQ